MGRRLASTVAALAVAMIVAACAGTGTPPPSTPASPRVAPTAVPTPPPPQPSTEPGLTPGTDVVVLRVSAVPDVAGPMPPTIVFADGSVLAPAANAFDVLAVRRLSPGGLERLLARVRGTGLLTESRTLLPARPPDSGFVTYTLAIIDDGRTIEISTINANPSAEGRRLIELADSILAPVEPVDPADWVDGDASPLPYRAAATRLTVELVALPAGDVAHPPAALDRLVWPLPGDPLDVGSPIATDGSPARALRCAIVSGEDEARLRMALRAAGAEPGYAMDDGLLRTWDLDAPLAGGIARVSLRPFIPGEAVGCDAVPLPEAPPLEPAPPPSFADFWAAARTGRVDDGTPLVSVDVFRSGPNGGEVASLVYTTGGAMLDRLATGAPAVGVAVRTLSVDGLARLRDLLADPALPDADLDAPAPDGLDAFTSYRVEGLLDGAWRTASVTDWQPGPDAAAVIALARRLVDPGAWAGRDGWWNDDASVHAWQPTWVELQVDVFVEEPDPSSLPPSSAVRWPLHGVLEDARCERIGFRDADSVVRALAAAGAAPEGPWMRGEYRLRSATPDAVVVVSLTPVVPGVGSCG